MSSYKTGLQQTCPKSPSQAPLSWEIGGLLGLGKVYFSLDVNDLRLIPQPRTLDWELGGLVRTTLPQAQTDLTRDPLGPA